MGSLSGPLEASYRLYFALSEVAIYHKAEAPSLPWNALDRRVFDVAEWPLTTAPYRSFTT